MSAVKSSAASEDDPPDVAAAKRLQRFVRSRKVIRHWLELIQDLREWDALALQIKKSKQQREHAAGTLSHGARGLRASG